MSAARASSGLAHLHLLGTVAGALFGVAGVLVPLGIISVAAVLAGAATFAPGDWLGPLLAATPLLAGAALSELWLRAAGVARAGRVTTAAGTLAACAGVFAMIALTPVLALLQLFGVLLPAEEAMAMLPVLAGAFGAVAGFFLWRRLAHSLGTTRELSAAAH